MSLTLQLALGVTALLSMLGAIMWRVTYTFDRDFPEQKRDAERQRSAR